MKLKTSKLPRDTFPLYAQIHETTCFHAPTYVRVHKTTYFHAPTYVQVHKTTCFHAPTYIQDHRTSRCHDPTWSRTLALELDLLRSWTIAVKMSHFEVCASWYRSSCLYFDSSKHARSERHFDSIKHEKIGLAVVIEIVIAACCSDPLNTRTSLRSSSTILCACICTGAH